MKASLIILLWLPCSWQIQQCLPSSDISQNKRYFQFEGNFTTLTIGTSDRVTHNVTSNILLIFLREVLGYDDVNIVYGDGTNSQNAFMLLFPRPEKKPKVIVNLEVWTDIEFEFPTNPDIEDLGLIAPLGRFGWFVRNNPNVTWQTLQKFDSGADFALKDDHLDVLNVHCRLHKCNDSYTPPTCLLQRQRCAVLLVDSSELNLEKIIKHVKEMNLQVQVKSIPKLSAAVALLPENLPVLVAAWYPDEITAFGAWHPVTFPACNTEFVETPGCMYDSRRMAKMVSKLVIKGARIAYEAVKNLHFNREDHLNFLTKSVNVTSLSHFDIACDWMRVNRSTWEKWKPRQVGMKPPLRICGIFPLGDMYKARFSSIGLPPAAEMAVAAVNNNPDILPNYELHLVPENGECNPKAAMNTFIDYVLGFDTKELVGILGPACSDSLESLVLLTTHFRTVVVTYSAEGSIFSISDREKYPYFFRTIGENLDFQQVYLKLLEQMKWTRMGALTEDTLKYTEYLTHLQNLLRAKGLHLENLKFIRSNTNATMATYVQDIKARRIRIIVADVHDSAARAVMCEAYHQQMTAKHGYVWFLPYWLSKNWYDIEKYKNVTRENLNCTTAQMKEAIQGYFSLAHQNFAPNATVTHENITVGEWKEKYKIELQRKLMSADPSVFAGYAYDAVWTYAFALDKLQRYNPSYMANIHSSEATKKYVEYIQETDFVGVTGRLRFSAGPSRTSPIDILQWTDGNLNTVGYFKHAEVMDGEHILLLNSSAIKWFTEDGKPPDDGGEEADCMLQGLADALNISCPVAIATANFIGFAIAGSLVVAAVIFYKRKYDKRIGELKVTEDYMKKLGLDLIPPPHVSDLDDWEIARDYVVINRKLGEGAFGTVYGGEVNIQGVWVAAAVKTLKPTASTEEKLDFLGEAELMKRFDHKNIVKLLGVCTRQEPCYTVMEFMLYGDLRSFLQNRRHIVTSRQASDESNDVSNKRLTSYALDIARGLSYLSSKKYVHRDIACRNCLLSSTKVAKIGDFGMTRRTYESDYYKFTRKGMMPIRWMAPESLVDGVFTTKSDVWAFGVVLFEIITFGSYPFPGLSNNEVIEFVRAGNNLAVPKGAKPQLESIMKLCWSQDKEKRPDPSDLVVFFASNPRVLSPCLDNLISGGVEPELLDHNMSAPNSPFGPAQFFTEGEEDQEPTSSSRFDDSMTQSLLPNSRAIELIQRAPLASRTNSDLEISSELI